MSHDITNSITGKKITTVNGAWHGVPEPDWITEDEVVRLNNKIRELELDVKLYKLLLNVAFELMRD